MSRFLRVDPSKDWEHYGKHNPFFGVLSNSSFLGKKTLDTEASEIFYKSGEDHIEKCLSTLAHTFGYAPEGKAMDFGCGVGRLTNAMSKHFRQVVGYDISQSMIETAEVNSSRMSNSNISYKCTENGFDPARGEFDFVHCYIVLQHIPVKDGMFLINRMLDSLREGGVGALHMTYAQPDNSIKEKMKHAIKEYWLLRAAYNAVRLKRLDAPLMQMNNYDLKDVFALLGKHGIDRFFCEKVDDWGNLGVFLFFEKGLKSKSIWSNARH